MLKGLASKVWRQLPQLIRVKAVRASQNKFTASVGAIILNRRGEILLLNHVLRPAEGWGIPGGFMNRNEQYFETIVREVFEETCLKIHSVELVSVHTSGNHIEFLITARADGEGKVNSFEIKDLKWFDPGNLPEKMTAGQKSTVKEVLSKIRK